MTAPAIASTPAVSPVTAPVRVGPLRGFARAMATPEGLMLLGPACMVLALGRGVTRWTGVNGLLVAAVVLVGVVVLGGGVYISRAKTYRMAVHTHGGHGTRLAARHEAGHYHVGRQVGGHVSGAEIFPDGSGVTYVDIPYKAGAAAAVAVAVAGQVAAGTSKGCDGFKGSDFDFKRTILRSLPADQRAAVEREGYALARRHCNGLFSPVPGIANRIYKDGRIS